MGRTHDALALPKGSGQRAHATARGLFLLAALLAGIALAEPRILGQPDPGTTEGIDLVVALDVSGSMRAADFRPHDRLFVAKKVIAERVLSRPRDRVGLVVFAGEAFTQAPLTHDKALLQEVLSGVRTGVLQDGTAIGDGLAISLARLENARAKTRAVILLTDGDNNAGEMPPESAAEMARDLGIQVYPILVGREGKVPFPAGVGFDGQPRFEKVEVPINPALLQKMATMTGGTYFLASDTGALEKSFGAILDALDRSLLENALPLRRPIPLAPLLLLPACLFLLASLTLSLTRASTVP